MFLSQHLLLSCVHLLRVCVQLALSPCCCLVKAASIGRGLVVTSGSLIKWIWFLRGNSSLLSLGARPSLFSI